MSRKVPIRLRRLVQLRAKFRCEYCLLSESAAGYAHQPDHILARKYGGATTPENLAWACSICNLLKGPETAALDPISAEPARLFNPRLDVWEIHFQLENGKIVGLTPIGRVSERALQFNRDDLVERRLLLMARGRYS